MITCCLFADTSSKYTGGHREDRGGYDRRDMYDQYGVQTSSGGSSSSFMGSTGGTGGTGYSTSTGEMSGGYSKINTIGGNYGSRRSGGSSGGGGGANRGVLGEHYPSSMGGGY